MNVFRPVSDDTVFKDRIYQGQSWGSTCFGRNASIQDYQDKGLYLEVSNKPISDGEYDDVVVQEVISHIDKKVFLVWDKVKKSDKKLKAIKESGDDVLIRLEVRALAIASCIAQGVLPLDYVDPRLTMGDDNAQ